MYVLQNSGVAASAAAALALLSTGLHSGTAFWLLVTCSKLNIRDTLKGEMLHPTELLSRT